MRKATGRAHSGQVRNILEVWDGATPEQRTAGAEWYRDAHGYAADMAHDAKLPVSVVAGVIAALSPGNRWERNLGDAKAVIASWAMGKSRVHPACSTWPSNVRKAKRILDLDGNPDTPITSILNGPKVTAFFWQILLPNRSARWWEEALGYVPVTIDGHAVNIARADRRPLSDVSVNLSQYRNLVASYVLASRKVGVAPSVLQATTWVAWRDAV